MVPDDKLDWSPAAGFMTMGQLLKHLSSNWVFLKMMVTNQLPPADPNMTMEESMKQENLPRCSKSEAIAGMKDDLNNTVAFIENEITENDFFSKEISAPWGFKGKIWEGAQMMVEHQINHKMQLHIYLKLLGKPVHTGTLYGM